MSSPHLHGPASDRPRPGAGPGSRPGAAHRRRVPLWLLALGFVAVPFVEIWSIVQVGQVVGAWWTLLLLLATGVLGAWLVRREGARTWRSLREAVRDGRAPHREVADGVLVLLGGALMLLPGFVSDVLGLLLVLPFTRPLARPLLARGVARRLDAAYDAVPPQFGGPFGGPVGGAAGRRPGRDDDVVQGEVVDP